MREGSNTIFITLTNDGYVTYTLNCLQSLSKIGLKEKMKCYVLGKNGFDYLSKRNVDASFLGDKKELTGFEKFRTGNWAAVTHYKFEVIHKNLMEHDYVCFFDGDIVFEDQKFSQYLFDQIGSYDLLIQNDTLEDDSDEILCTGFMFIRSNENTLNIFHPDNAAQNALLHDKWDDQVYINDVKKQLNFEKLPLSLFPNGKYFIQNRKTITPYLIHFNYFLGHEKALLMILFGKVMSPAIRREFIRKVSNLKFIGQIAGRVRDYFKKYGWRPSS